jgi:hypothetical protein
MQHFQIWFSVKNVWSRLRFIHSVKLNNLQTLTETYKFKIILRDKYHIDPSIKKA